MYAMFQAMQSSLGVYPKYNIVFPHSVYKGSINSLPRQAKKSLGAEYTSKHIRNLENSCGCCLILFIILPNKEVTFVSRCGSIATWCETINSTVEYRQLLHQHNIWHKQLQVIGTHLNMRHNASVHYRPLVAIYKHCTYVCGLLCCLI